MTCMKGSRRIKRIVEDLKDFARRDETGAREIIDLNAVAQAAVRLVDVSIKKATSSFQMRPMLTIFPGYAAMHSASSRSLSMSF